MLLFSLLCDSDCEIRKKYVFLIYLFGCFFYLITLTGLIGETKHVSNTLQTFFPSSKLKKMPVKKTAGAKMHPNGLEELHSQSKHIHALKTIYNKILGKGLQM